MEQWAELRREHFVAGKSIKELARRDGAVAQHDPAGAAQRRRRRAIERAPGGSKLEPFKDGDPSAAARGSEAAGRPGPRAARAAGLHARARRSSMTTCARCGRCSRRRRGRFSGRSIGRARSASSMSGSRAREVPVGHGQTRRGWVVVACLGYSRAGAGVLVFSQADRGSAGRDRRLPAAAGRAAADAGLGSPGRHPRPRRPPDARRSPRSAAS